MPQIESSIIGAILTDPPFLYLKGQKLERPFDEVKFFSEAFRVLTDDGIIAFFGRGESFYRWNNIVKDVGFSFLEEVIWDKGRITSPALPLGRCHETVAIWRKGRGYIRKAHVPYLEQKAEIEEIAKDIKRMRSVLVNSAELDKVNNYLTTGVKEFDEENKSRRFKTSISGGIKGSSRCQNVMSNMREGGD